MSVKHLKAGGLFLLLMSLPTLSAAKLQMHVFEENVPTNQNDSGDSQTQNNKASIPENDNYVPVGEVKRPETLKVHVYESKPKKTSPFFAYETADVYLKTGYRRDEFRWSIAGNFNFPNILSELRWRDLEIATLNIGTNLQMKNNWFVMADVLWGEIYDGTNQDSDYFGNNRTQEFSRSNNGADEGNVFDVSAGFGYRFQWGAKQENGFGFELKPKVGLAYHSQDLKIVDAFQTVSNAPFIPPVGPIFGADSSYDTTWFGPFVGLETAFFQRKRFRIGLNVEYHYVEYDATAQWNLRQDFAQPESFRHKADGDGWVTELSSEWYFTKDLALTMDLMYQKWNADRDGRSTIFFADGSIGITPFNEARWEGYGVSFGLNYDF